MAYRYRPDPELEQFCTPQQLDVLRKALALETYDGVANALGLEPSVVKQRIGRLHRKAARKGYVPEHGLTVPLPDGQHLRGATIQRKHFKDGTSRITTTWTKSWQDRDGHVQALLDAAERAGESCKGVGGITPAPSLDTLRPDLLALYGAGDPHFGMQAWHRVAGGNWDLKVAEQSLVDGLELLAGSAPPAREAVFLNAGDLFHADDNSARTPRSGHALDVDNRWSKVLDVVIRTYKRLATMLLAKHEQVRFITLPGNHDPQSALILQVLLKLMFEDDPRITVDDDRHLYTRYRFGCNFLGFHHGHGLKGAELVLHFATRFDVDWATALARRIYTGHKHKEEVQSFQGTPVEVLPSLCAGDKYAADEFGGLAQRSILCDTWHRDRGRVQRNLTAFRHINQGEE